MPTILNIYRMRSANIGDIKSSPFDYISIPGYDVIRHDILDPISPEYQSAWCDSTDRADAIFIGGGGLLDLDFFSAALDEIYLRRRQGQKLILWGSGHNNYNLASWANMRHVVDLMSYNYDLIGQRDYGSSYHWAPCPSCLDPAFDKEYPITRKAVLYKHIETVVDDDIRRVLPEDIVTLDNYANFESVIDHLGSAEMVLTSSFHGAYWATLLGRKVVAFPFSSKFYDLRHSVPLCDIRDWQRFSVLSSNYPNALQDCRDATNSFYLRVIDALGR